MSGRSGLTGLQIQRLAENYAAKLGEHCESVLIVATFHSSKNQHCPTHPEGDSCRLVTRSGSYYANRSLLECFMKEPGTFWTRMKDAWLAVTGRRQTLQIQLGNRHASRGAAGQWLNACAHEDQMIDAPAEQDDDDEDGETV